MASKRKLRNGRYSIAVIVHPGPGEVGKRRRPTIRLRTTNEREADEACEMIQELADRHEDGHARSKQLNLWLDRQPAKVRDRLERRGLVESSPEKLAASEAEQDKKQQKKKTTVKRLTDRFLDSKKDTKESTQLTFKNIVRNLIQYFGPDRQISEITPQDAAEFRVWLKNHGNKRDVDNKRREKDAGTELSENTVRRRTGLARQVFRVAIQARWIDENPFDGLPASFQAEQETGPIRAA